jgi:hypothetical protein
VWEKLEILAIFKLEDLKEILTLSEYVVRRG